MICSSLIYYHFCKIVAKFILKGEPLLLVLIQKYLCHFRCEYIAKSYLFLVKHKMSPMPSTPSSSGFYRNLWRLTERNKKRKNESLTNSHSNSDEVVSDHSNVPQQEQQQSKEMSYEAQDVSSPKGLFYFLCFLFILTLGSQHFWKIYLEF